MPQPSQTSFLADRTEFWTRAMTSISSVSGTADEAAFSRTLAQMLRDSESLAGVEIDVIDVPAGPHNPLCVLAWLRGDGAKTVMLTGHYDIVSMDNYAELKPVALAPDALVPALLAQIANEPETPQSRLTADDLRSGAFMPGRGLLDMKAGLAAGLAVLELAATDPNRKGNLLFAAVPDEEVNSIGARRLAEVLPGWAKHRCLDLVAAINLDAIADDGDGSAGRAIGLGTIGKLLPSALVLGKAVHASYAWRGLGAPSLAGALSTEMEWATDLVERTGDELTAGPTLLGMKDNKVGYDVTQPESVWMYWNIGMHRRSAAEVMDNVKQHARRAADALTQVLEARRREAGAAGALPQVEVLSFAELFAEAGSDDILAYAEGLMEKGLDVPEQCRLVTEALWRKSGRSGPAIVLGFASTPYLPVTLGQDDNARRLEAASRAAAASIAEQFQTSIAVNQFFPAISDISFLGQGDETGLAVVGHNTPVWKAALRWPEGTAIAGVPMINAGPWGRDYHGRFERMHIGYGFAVLPALLAEICRLVLHPAPQ